VGGRGEEWEVQRLEWVVRVERMEGMEGMEGMGGKNGRDLRVGT
jgi:hypothetical protein